ncbi:TIGR00266 family protein [archaeon]|nr:TIGR00266 family protein [archaeon]
MEFTTIGQGDPFLHIKLNKGEKIYCESNAMVTMDATLELKAKMQGGLFAALGRKLANGESFFNQYIEATSGQGETLLSPELPGDIQILDIGGSNQYLINDGAFLAASEHVNLEVKMQNLSGAIFGGTGGLFVTRTSGQGKLAVSGLGTMMEMHVSPDNPMIVDNYHVVAWDQSLQYELSVSTNKQGLLSNLVNSVTSGEGIVTKFKGTGKIYVCSRNRGAFIQWIRSQASGK